MDVRTMPRGGGVKLGIYQALSKESTGPPAMIGRESAASSENGGVWREPGFGTHGINGRK